MHPRRIFFSISLLIFSSICSRSIAQRPELVVQTGHGNSVVSVAFSPDGKYIVSSGNDGSILLWEIDSGRQIRSLENKGYNNPIYMSSNGKFLSSGKEIKVWDISTGEELKLKDATAPAAISRDGTIVAATTGFMSDKISLLDVGTSRVLRTFDGCSRQKALTFSPDGKIVAAACDPLPQGSGAVNGKIKLLPGRIKLWDVSTGRELRAFEAYELGANSIAFTPDSKSLVSTSDTEPVKIWDAGNGKLRRSIDLHGESMAISPDGQTLAVGGGYEDTTKLYELATGQLQREVPGSSSKVAFSPDGHVLANSVDTTIQLLDLSASRQPTELKKHSHTPSAVAVSANGQLLAEGSVNGGVMLWDFSGKEPRLLPEHSDQRPWALAFSSDNRLLAAGGSTREQSGLPLMEQHGVIDVWDVETDKKLYSLKGDSTTELTSLVFSDDNKTLIGWQGSSLVEESGRGIKVWDALTGKELRTVGGPFSTAKSVVFSSNSNVLASLNFNAAEKKAQLEVWDAGAATRLRAMDEEMPAGSEYSYHIALSADGKTLVRVFDTVVGEEVLLKIRLWNVATGESQEIISKHNYGARALALSSDGSLVAVTLRMSRGEEIKLWDVKTQKEIAGITGATGSLGSLSLESIVFSKDSRFLIAGGYDNSIRLLDASEGDELARLIGVDEKDWLVVSPQGLFDGSSQGWQRGVWRFSNKTSDFAPVETYFREFYYPNLLGDVAAGKHPKATARIEELDRRQLRLSLTLAAGPAPTASVVTSRTAQVRIHIEEAPAGARDLRLFRNGSLIKLWAGDLPPNQELTADIPIVAGENRLTAYAFNHSNIKSGDVTLNVTGEASLQRPGTLHIFTIGVGQYANSQYNLNYTVADAEAFGDEVKRQQERLGRYARIEVVSLLDQKATKSGILSELKKLAETVQPEDGVIVYFSGHGTAQNDRFYLIPHDLGYLGPREQLSAAALQTVVSHSISDVELEEAFRAIDAGQLLLVIDACNSGQALEAEEKRRGPMNTKGLAQLAYEKGMSILTASQSVELAFESEALKHSYLTYALIEEGLRNGAADKAPADGQVLLREWFDFTTDRVPRMRQQKVEQSAKRQGKSLELVEAAEQGKVQTPRVFYRREPDATPFVVAKTAITK